MQRGFRGLHLARRPEHVCQALCEYRHVDEASCTTDSECTWENNQCRFACRRMGAEEACSARTACEWVASESRCVYHPHLASEGAMAYACSKQCAIAYTSKAACDANANCMWSVADKTCGETCRRYNVREHTTMCSPAR